MNKTFRKAFTFILLLTTIVLLLFIFLPRTYDVPQYHTSATTQYWKLPTGSTIGYHFFKGKGERKPYPLIFLNGGPGGAISTEAITLRSKLAEDGYDVYMYDQVGSGASTRLKNINDYSPERHRADLAAIIQLLGAKKVILIGHSWGAILAVLYAAEYPSTIDKIIFTCPGPIYPFRKELLDIKTPDSLDLKAPLFTNAAGNRKVSTIRSKAMAYFATHFGWKIATDQEADAFETLLDYEVNKSTVMDTAKIATLQPGGGFYAAVMTFKNLLTVTDPRPKLQHSTIPVLVMKAQYDNQHWGFTNEYLQLFPNHTLVVIPDAGHAVSLEQPELYLKTIRDFLAQ